MKILFVHQKLEPYVAKDLEILRCEHDVRVCEFAGIRHTTWHRLLQDIFAVAQGTMWCDVTFSWFGKLHAFFAVMFSKILRKPAIVVAGGEDVTRYTLGGYRYGLLWSPIRRWFAHFTFRHADLVLAVSKQVYHEAASNVGMSLDRLQMLYHGFDPERFRRPIGVRKEAAVAIISNLSWENWYCKGLDVFVGAAELLPNVKFYIVGPPWAGSLPFWQQRMPENVVVTGGLYGDELVGLLSRMSVYVQPSRYESFCCAVAEAMLCECVPIVSDRGALPEVVGDCALYVRPLSGAALVEKVKEALLHPELGKRARQRIIEKFPLSQRRAGLLQALEGVAANRRVRS